MKKIIIKSIVLSAVFVLNTLCFANNEGLNSWMNKRDNASASQQKQVAPKAQESVGFKNNSWSAKQDDVTQIAQAPVVQKKEESSKTQAKVAFKNPVMEHKLNHTSGDGSISLEELIKDKKAVLLDFYTTWCGPCKQLMPELKKTSDKLAPQGVSVVGVNVDRNLAGAEGIKKQNGINFPWLVEGADETHSKHFKVDSYPRTVLLSQDGEVLFNGHPQDPSLKTALSKLGVSL